LEQDIVIIGGARTPLAEYSGTPGFGALAEVSAIELGALASQEAMRRIGLAPELIEHVVFGNVLQTSADAVYGARHVGLKAGIPETAPALTVNRICGSGIQALISSVYLMRSGEASLCLVGGMENMSQAPHVLRGARNGYRFGSKPALEDSLFEALMDTHCDLMMAQTAENLARSLGITREQQDDYALRSHRLGADAVAQGLFAEEIVPVVVGRGKRAQTVDQDDHIKAQATLESLARLRPAFGEGGTVTAGNASGIVDGAAALILATADRAAELGLRPRARIQAWASAGVPPEIMGIGPVPAIHAALGRATLEISDIDRFEINEAFAAQYLAVEKELGLDRNKVNVNGGAIALGHPLGATGARLVLTLLHELERSQTRLGCASACIGGGQGIALILERL